jgi:betaine-aldehyde dehydrogenase
MRRQLYVDGQWISGSGEMLPVIDPARAVEIGQLQGADAGQAGLAVAAAGRAFAAWSTTPSPERGRYLGEFALALAERKAALARLSSQVNGKPLFEAELDIDDAAACFAYYAELAAPLDARQDAPVAVGAAGISARLRREPAGVAALITPWNFPFVTAAWKIAPALAAGCAVVWKPSEVTAAVELELGAIAEHIGLPPGVLNVVPGTGAAVGDRLCRHPGVAKVSFTGSNPVGAAVMAAAAADSKTVSLELGGKSAIVVFADADLDLATDLVAGGIFFNAGQMCSATSRVLVEAPIAEALCERLVERARGLRLGAGLEPGVDMGPLTTAAQHRKVLGAIDAARASGARLCVGGGDLQGELGGYFVSPAVFAHPDLDSALWREEIFGPVMALASFSTEAEAVALANDSRFGLVASVVSADLDRAQRVAARLKVGHVWINTPQLVLPETSWGGYGQSGVGRELGPWGLAAYQEIKHVIGPA